MLIATVFTIASAFNNCVHGWMDKENMIYIISHVYIMENCSTIKKKGNLAVCDNIDGLLSGIMLSEINKT